MNDNRRHHRPSRFGDAPALIVIPDSRARSREHRLDAQQVFHLPGLENPALRVDQRDAVAPGLAPCREIRKPYLWTTSTSGSKPRSPNPGLVTYYPS
jgi:hypothetical protein